jgi:serine/threonine-protein kinase RsbW
VTEETVELTLPSRVESVAEAAGTVADAARRLGFAEDALFGIDMAVREAVTNAVLHGNGGDEAKPVELGLSGTDAGLVVTVRDRGEGFDPAQVADPTREENLLKASGRGILFMRTFMDEVDWRRHPEGGTVVRMTKKK